MVVVFRIYQLIASYAYITQKEIIEITELSEKAVRNCLKKLLLRNLILELNNVNDMRFKRYKVREVENDKIR